MDIVAENKWTAHRFAHSTMREEEEEEELEQELEPEQATSTARANIFVDFISKSHYQMVSLWVPRVGDGEAHVIQQRVRVCASVCV